MFMEGSGGNTLDLKCVCLSQEGVRHKMKWKAQAGAGEEKRERVWYKRYRYKRREKLVKEGKLKYEKKG